jgi:hypothetical protein
MMEERGSAVPGGRDSSGLPAAGLVVERFARYGRLYAALAPLCLCLSFLPPFAVGGTGVNATVESFGTVWDMAGTPGGGPARAAVLLVVILFGGLLAVAVWPDLPPLPVINAICAVTIGALLWTRPATGDPPPHLSPAGQAQLAVAAGVVVVSVIHLTHLHRRRTAPRFRRPAAAEAPPGSVAAT